MASETSCNAPKAGLSLYANLLDPSSFFHSTPGTISRAPVVFKQPTGEDSQPHEASAQKQQISAASLRFQPTKRPQITLQRSKPKQPTQKATPPIAGAVSQESASLSATSPTLKPAMKVTLADWTADRIDDDANDFFGGEKRQRGGRKKRKKNKEESAIIVHNWDDIYDPSRPNSYEEYQNSDEKILEMREWKDKLYSHRSRRRQSSDTEDSDTIRSQRPENPFVPTRGLSFAPPALFDDHDLPHPTSVPGDPTGEDAYDRRIQLSQAGHQTVIAEQTPGPPQGSLGSSLTWPLPPSQQVDVPLTHMPHSLPAVASTLPPTISMAPVRYKLPPAPPELPKSKEDLADALNADGPNEETASESGPRSIRPGQKDFAERLMSKYGWTKGSGLGASGAGIINPLRVQVEKQKKKPDSEGGGFVGPGGRGKIIGGRKQGGFEITGKFGTMSEVVVLYGMVDGMDLDAELEGVGDGGIMQEIGEECEEKYGRVERVFIDRNNPLTAPVFLKFTSQLSALRAVNALEGRIFNGNTITARFFETEKFENGVYA